MTVDPAVAIATEARPNAMTVDLGAVAHNVRQLRTQLGGDFTFVAALKANAYGFGLTAIADAVLAAGADALAVASLDDVISLRASGVRQPIILYGGTRPNRRVIDEVVEHDVTVTILDDADVAAYGAAGSTVRALVKVDVGLERLGVEPDGAVALTRRVVESARPRAGRAVHPPPRAARPDRRRVGLRRVAVRPVRRRHHRARARRHRGPAPDRRIERIDSACRTG